MIRYLLAGAALAVIASPAEARDHSAYFGLEVGPMFAQDVTVKNNTTGNDAFRINHKLGVDGDLIAGYDFGIVRAEIEAGHKWATQEHSFELANGNSVDGFGHTSGYSGMGNLLLDLGKNDTVNFYVGAGGGLAWMHERSTLHLSEGPPAVNLESRIESKGHFAWQGIAGIRAPVFRSFDVGLKYRYFDAGHFSDNGLRGEFKSHSVLASLIYNFNTEPPRLPPPPPPPAPPPPPPATQTCPDGSVILATDVCPAPPPPPPPPPPTPERGN